MRNASACSRLKSEPLDISLSEFPEDQPRVFQSLQSPMHTHVAGPSSGYPFAAPCGRKRVGISTVSGTHLAESAILFQLFPKLVVRKSVDVVAGATRHALIINQRIHDRFLDGLDGRDKERIHSVVRHSLH